MTAPPAIRTILITAGPTHEPIDRVRFLANRSSGLMGLELARAAIQFQNPCPDASPRAVADPSAARAATAPPNVLLLLGPVDSAIAREAENLTTTGRLQLHRFTTTADLESLLASHWPAHADILIMAAAVSDFRPASPSAEKIRRTENAPTTLTLLSTPDLLAGCAARKRPGQFVLGFALQPAADLEAAGRAKLQRKGLDAVILNPLQTMNSPDVAASLLWADGRREVFPLQPKSAFARALLSRLPL